MMEIKGNMNQHCLWRSTKKLSWRISGIHFM